MHRFYSGHIPAATQRCFSRTFGAEVIKIEDPENRRGCSAKQLSENRKRQRVSCIYESGASEACASTDIVTEEGQEDHR